MRFAERLRKVLDELEMSQLDLAAEIDMARNTVNQYCTGSKTPSLEVFYRICLALNQDANYMLGLDD